MFSKYGIPKSSPFNLLSSWLPTCKCSITCLMTNHTSSLMDDWIGHCGTTKITTTTLLYSIQRLFYPFNIIEEQILLDLFFLQFVIHKINKNKNFQLPLIIISGCSCSKLTVCYTNLLIIILLNLI